MPRPIVLGATPVAAATAAMPPRPAATASEAATSRRPRSLRNGATVSNRWRIKAVSITSDGYANLLILGIPPDPQSIRLFSDGPLGPYLAVIYSSFESPRWKPCHS